MRRLFFTYLLLTFSFAVLAQENGDFLDIYKNAESIFLSQPEETIKITDHLLHNFTDSHQQIQAYLLRMGSYYVMGDFNEAVKAATEAKKIAEITDDQDSQIIISISSLPLLNHLGLEVVAKEYYLRTEALLEENPTEEITNYLEGGIALNNAYDYFKNGNNTAFIDNLEKANLIFYKIPDPILLNETEASIIEVYLNITDFDSAQTKFQSVLEKTNGIHPNNFIKMVTMTQLGRLYFLRKEYSQSRIFYQNALELAEKLNNKRYQSKIKEGLSNTYLVLDEAPLFFSIREESDQLTNEVEIEENKAINSIYNYINDNHTAIRDNVKKSYQQNLLILSGALLFLLLIWMALRYRYKRRARQYERFISYFKNKTKPQEITPVKEISKSLNIPQETENNLAQKLRRFENSKQFTKQDMSLASLAAHFDTNTKYLSEIINNHKGKNFNAYINELRINYVIDKLKHDSTYLQYKISYLAEESGFSSHSSFATVFKAVTGIPPTVFIELLKTKKEASKTFAEEYEEVE